MRITSVEAHALSSPIEPIQSRRFAGGVRRLLKRDVVLVVVETADGRQGFAPAGASSSSMREYFQGDTQAGFAEVMCNEVADAVVGLKLEGSKDVGHVMQDANLPDRIVTEATSALDIAYYDLLGKEHEVPIAELLAEATDEVPQQSIPLYASAGMYMAPEGYAAQAKAIESLGFVGYKYRPGIGPADDKATVDAIAAELDSMEFMLDAHTWWKLDDNIYSREVVDSIADHALQGGAYWIEEPVSPTDYEGYRRLGAAGIPLAGGESEADSDGLISLAETGAISFLQGDVRHHGGFTGCLSVIQAVSGTKIEFVPHNFGTWLGLVANAHLVAAAPEVGLLEYPVFEGDPVLNTGSTEGMYPFPLAFDILKHPLEITDGRLKLPSGPGLGVDVDLSVIDEYPQSEGSWTEFIYDMDDDNNPSVQSHER